MEEGGDRTEERGGSGRRPADTARDRRRESKIRTGAIGAQRPNMNREQQGLTARRRSCGKDHCSRNPLIGCGELSH